MTEQPPEETGWPETLLDVPEGLEHELDLVMGGPGIITQVIFRPKPPRSAAVNLPAGKAGKVKGRMKPRRIK